jgi:Ca2+-binding EF-hand superfamily protein
MATPMDGHAMERAGGDVVPASREECSCATKFSQFLADEERRLLGQAFALIDVNGDGVLSKEDFVK